MMATLVLYFSLLELLFNVVCSQTCGLVGHNDQSNRNREEDPRFYLNAQVPAACDGTVTSWQYCYYPPSVNGAEEYEATFAMYRQMGSNYQRVSDTLRIVIPGSDIGNQAFTCRTFSSSEVTVQQGDMIGVCIQDVFPNFNRRAQLNLIGQSGGRLLRTSEFDTEEGTICNIGSGSYDLITPPTISSSDLQNRNNRILHLYADIVAAPGPETTIGPGPPTTSDSTTPTPEMTSEPSTTLKTTSAITTLPPTTTTTVSNNPTMLATTENQDPTTTSTNSMTSTMIPILENGTSPTTSEPITELFSTFSTTSNQDTAPNMDNTASKDIAALIGGILVAVLVLLVIFTVVAIVVMVVCRRRRKSTKSHSLQNINTASNEIFAAGGINNITYEPFTDKAKTEAATSGIPQPQDYLEASSFASHTYEYTSDSPYEEVMNGNPNVYESPLDVAAVSYSALLEKNKTEDIYGELDPYRAPPSLEDEIYRHLQTYGITSIPRSDLESSSHLGSGQFGNVEKGWWKRHGNGGRVPVALKTLNKGSLEEEKVKFLQEAAIMAQFKHPNVIKLYGVVSKGEPITLVVELAQKGDLRYYLHSIRPDPGELPPAHLPSLLLSFSQQVALGMQYLSGKGFVHRDLAARNIFVTENKICKVADFGMSRDLADENYYVSHGGKIPVKWTAPEALNFKKYSTASDIWSYGCLLYEIWSLGHKPFERISNMETITTVDSGRRLPPPPGCPRMMYSLMMQCWHPETIRRPSFRNLVLSQVGDKNAVLSIPREALETHQLAGVLGAPLATGEMMYRDIQNTYLSMAHLQQNLSLSNDYEEF